MLFGLLPASFSFSISISMEFDVCSAALIFEGEGAEVLMSRAVRGWVVVECEGGEEADMLEDGVGWGGVVRGRCFVGGWRNSGG